MTDDMLRARMEQLLASIESVASALLADPLGDHDVQRAGAYRSCATWLRRALAEPDTRVHGVTESTVTELLLDRLAE